MIRTVLPLALLVLAGSALLGWLAWRSPAMAGTASAPSRPAPLALDEPAVPPGSNLESDASPLAIAPDATESASPEAGRSAVQGDSVGRRCTFGGLKVLRVGPAGPVEAWPALGPHDIASE